MIIFMLVDLCKQESLCPLQRMAQPFMIEFGFSNVSTFLVRKFGVFTQTFILTTVDPISHYFV